MTQDREDRLRRLGGLARDVKSAHSGYRSVNRGRRFVAWAAGVLVTLLVVAGVTAGGDDDDDNVVTGPVPAQVDDDDADDDD